MNTEYNNGFYLGYAEIVISNGLDSFI